MRLSAWPSLTDCSCERAGRNLSILKKVWRCCNQSLVVYPRTGLCAGHWRTGLAVRGVHGALLGRSGAQNGRQAGVAGSLG